MTPMHLTLLSSALITLMASQLSFADIEGEKTLFIMEKSLNFENKMIIHTQTDDQCKFIPASEGDQDYVDFYWMMDGKNRKEVHRLIRKKINERLEFDKINAERTSYTVRLNDLTEVKHDLDDTLVEITSQLTDGKCKVKSTLVLGASNDRAKINLDKIFCQVSKNRLGIPNGCKYIEIEGTHVKTGAPVKAHYDKR